MLMNGVVVWELGPFEIVSDFYFLLPGDGNWNGMETCMVRMGGRWNWSGIMECGMEWRPAWSE